jgi:cation diffusion facilitator family transporter
MNDISSAAHTHVFLGAGHEANERRTWMVIGLCAAMMALEIVGGLLFGSIALVADGLHMSTHAGALLLAAIAYAYARRYAYDQRVTFGTGEFGDLAGFTSAIVLAMIALFIGYEAVTRLIAPVPIAFGEAIPIATLGLVVNIVSVLLLSGGDYGHHHGHDPRHEHSNPGPRIETGPGTAVLQVFEDGVPPRFRLTFERGTRVPAHWASIETVRAGGERQVFNMAERGLYLESIEEIPEPHAFMAHIRLGGDDVHSVVFEEHEHAHASAHHDHNIRAAIVHVLADAAVSVLVIVGLLLARYLGWMFMDPVAGICGALVISLWSDGLIRDTGAILLDMNPDRALAERVRAAIECDGDQLKELHLWCLGPGHLGAILSVTTSQQHNCDYYRRALARFHNLSHVTIEVDEGPLLRSV